MVAVRLPAWTFNTAHVVSLVQYPPGMPIHSCDIRDPRPSRRLVPECRDLPADCKTVLKLGRHDDVEQLPAAIIGSGFGEEPEVLMAAGVRCLESVTGLR